MLTAEIANTGGWNLADVEKVVAQRAYDLALHVIDHLNHLPSKRVTLSGSERRAYLEELLADVPDLTEWPDTPEEQHNIACAVCGKVYVQDAPGGWFGHRDGDTRRVSVFCSEMHLNQWKAQRDSA